MKENISSHQLAILVLSCDKYSDLWDDFINLKERFWPDCPYPCYLATDTVDYKREGVKLIHFGNIRLWSVCAQKALEKIPEPYVALFLEDAFIYKTIDTSIIAKDLLFAIDNKADFITLERNRMEKKLTDADQIAPHIWRIDKHRKYGIDTSAAIWNKEFLMEELSKEDCNAWQFEVKYCKMAETDQGLPGAIFFDDRQPFNISPVEVVRLGKLSPTAVRFFHKIGYDISASKIEKMNWWQSSIYDFRAWLKKHHLLLSPIKNVAKLLGLKFFT